MAYRYIRKDIESGRNVRSVLVLEEEVNRNTMKKKTKIIIAAVAVIVLAAIAAGGFFLVNQKLSKTEYEEQMKTAEKYLSSGDDEKAILAYAKKLGFEA